MNPLDRKEMQRLIATGIHPTVAIDVLIERWNRKWAMGGEELRCRVCDVAQWPSNAQEPLPHRQRCSQAEFEHPWYDLTGILQALTKSNG